MARRVIAPIIPRDEREHRIYHGNLILANLHPATALGEAVLRAYDDREPLGMGSEKVVYPHVYRKDRAVAIYQNWGEKPIAELKQIYFTRKLMHLLWPDNIPDAHFVGFDPPRMELDMVTSQPMRDDQFARLYAELKAKTGSTGIFLDPKPSNFLLGDDGNLKYVDDFGLPDDLRGLENEIQKIEDPATRDTALEYASRASLQLPSLAELVPAG